MVFQVGPVNLVFLLHEVGNQGVNPHIAESVGLELHPLMRPDGDLRHILRQNEVHLGEVGADVLGGEGQVEGDRREDIELPPDDFAPAGGEGELRHRRPGQVGFAEPGLVRVHLQAAGVFALQVSVPVAAVGNQSSGQALI